LSKKAILLRIDPQLWPALEKWAADEFRSVNGQIEYLLDRALKEAGRRPASASGKHRSTDHPRPGLG
jgi:hypothetical protein